MKGLTCTRVISRGHKPITCDRQLKQIGFSEGHDGVFRLACEDHWLIRKEVR
jgi:hypothetical protein